MSPRARAAVKNRRRRMRFALWLSGPAAEAEETKFGRPVAVPFRLTAQPMEAHPSAPFIASSAFRRDRSNKNLKRCSSKAGRKLNCRTAEEARSR